MTLVLPPCLLPEFEVNPPHSPILPGLHASLPPSCRPGPLRTENQPEIFYTVGWGPSNYFKLLVGDARYSEHRYGAGADPACRRRAHASEIPHPVADALALV